MHRMDKYSNNMFSKLGKQNNNPFWKRRLQLLGHIHLSFPFACTCIQTQTNAYTNTLLSLSVIKYIRHIVYIVFFTSCSYVTLWSKLIKFRSVQVMYPTSFPQFMFLCKTNLLTTNYPLFLHDDNDKCCLHNTNYVCR